jgi:hypothetical protein
MSCCGLELMNPEWVCEGPDAVDQGSRVPRHHLQQLTLLMFDNRGGC